MLKPIRRPVLVLAAVFASGLLFVNVYNSLVDAPNWGADIPSSIDAARHYFTVRNPGDFYRYFSPANQIITLIGLIAVWPLGWRMRMLAFWALTISVLSDVMTFTYFYPRNDIMFNTTPMPDADALRNAWSGWSTMNWVR